MNERMWTVRGMKDALAPKEPTEYLVDKYLPTHSLNIFYGAPGCLKSMVLLDIALAVAAGRRWLGEVDVIQRPVMWIDLDNGTRRMDIRTGALAKHYGMGVDNPFHYVSMPQPPPHELNGWAEMGHLVKDLGVGFLIVDNLGMVLGDVDENSAEMAGKMGEFRFLVEKMGVALVLLHHQRKGGAGGARSGDSLRGHSSIEASLDLGILITREEGTNDITLKSTKTRDVDVPTQVARFNYIHQNGTNDLKEAWWESVIPVREAGELTDTIIWYVDEHERILKTKLAMLVHEGLDKRYGLNRVRAEIDDLLERGEILMTEGKYNAKVIVPVP